MIDKAKYASHGVFIKKISENYLGRWDKPKSAVINPIPTTKPRQKGSNEQQQNMMLASRTFNAKFKFQQPLNKKSVPQDLIQPFIYIQKVIKKRKVDEDQHQEDNKKGKDKKGGKVLQPFITSKNSNKNQSYSAGQKTTAPHGYSNLYEFQTDKRSIASLIFQKMLQSGIDNVKDLFNLWNKEPRRNLTSDINIKEEQFIDFIKELIPNKVTTSNIKHFFRLYRNKASAKKTDKSQKKAPVGTEKIQEVTLQGQISIRAFSYNYSKYKKAETQITNIMSEKAAKDRYTELKKYVADFLGYYPELKIGMKGVKQYEETLRKHFRRLYDSYKNPFQEEIKEFKSQLQKPIIKYDKEKKEKFEKKIQQYESENQKMYTKLTEDFSNFMDAYQDAIVKNHDLFFTKRTVTKLLQPVINSQPLLIKDMIEQQVGVQQDQKQRYLEILSDIIVEMDNDKKHLNENCFTLGQIVQIVSMRYRNKQTKQDEEAEAFMIRSLKKLIKQVKRQFLIKYNLVADDPDNFPADQQIPMEILHTCFEMQCTKVLFKNKIWTELLQMLPSRTVESRLHQRTIDANTCMEYLLKYFKKLDERSRLELNKSKQISLLVENAYNQNFGYYADIIWKVIRNVDTYVEGADQQQALMLPEKSKKKKVGFADIVDSKLAVQRGQRLPSQKQQNMEVVKNMLKLIHQGAQGKTSSILKNESKQGYKVNPTIKITGPEDSPQEAFQNLQMLKSMAKSYFQPQAMNTNAFDIRFYQKIAEQEKQNKMPQQQVVQLGSSMILTGAPRVQELAGNDPLRISRFLLKNIDKQVQQQQKAVHNKQYEKDIYEGVSKNYYKQKIKLENRPTRYDSEGKSKYSVLLPVGYYESYIVGQSVPDNEKWYLRPHHVQTLTENPLSKKDNIIQTEYQSKLQKLGLKKRPDQFVIEENVKRKQNLISQLEERIQVLKREVVNAKRGNDAQGQKVHPHLVDKYYVKIAEGKEDKELELAAYEGVLYDLRKKQRQLLNQYRGNETRQRGEPNEKWWQKKDKDFNRQFRKDREMVSDSSGLHRKYVQKLKNNEVY